MRQSRYSGILIATVLLVMVVIVFGGRSPAQPVTEDYLFEMLEGARVKRVHVTQNKDGSSTFTADLHSGRRIAVTERDARPLRSRLAEEGVPVEEAGDAVLTEFLFKLVPWVLVFTVFVLFLKRAMAHVDIRREPNVVRLDQTSPRPTLRDLHGLDGPVAELRAIVQDLRQDASQADGVAKPIHGCLLTGSTGTGKTLLVRALAGEVGLPVLSSPTAEFVELFVGLGAVRMRRLMGIAAKQAPAIVFLDDVDGIARRRTTKDGTLVEGEREHTLGQLFESMDRLASDGTRVLLLAATNRPDLLDEALLRPGRIERVIEVGAPDAASRQAILRGHLAKRSVEGIDVDALVTRTDGWVGADLEGLADHLSSARSRGGAPGAPAMSTGTHGDVEAALETIGRVRRARETAASSR